jgi:hypothetical protein
MGHAPESHEFLERDPGLECRQGSCEAFHRGAVEGVIFGPAAPRIEVEVRRLKQPVKLLKLSLESNFLMGRLTSKNLHGIF